MRLPRSSAADFIAFNRLNRGYDHGNLVVLDPGLPRRLSILCPDIVLTKLLGLVYPQ